MCADAQGAPGLHFAAVEYHAYAQYTVIIMRSVLSILLSLILVVTSHSMALARTADQPQGQMVICSGEDTFVVYIDADGQPLPASHLCPDCALQALPATMPPILALARTLSATVVSTPDEVVPDNRAAYSRALARAPPVSV